MSVRYLVYKLLWRPWFWLSQFLEEHPEKFVWDWPCQCATCRDYEAEWFPFV